MKTMELIKETARKVFFSEGNLNAPIKDIADKAGIRRTVVHYYFRNQEILYNQMKGELLLEFSNRVDNIPISKGSLHEKTSALLDVLINKWKNIHASVLRYSIRAIRKAAPSQFLNKV